MILTVDSNKLINYYKKKKLILNNGISIINLNKLKLVLKEKKITHSDTKSLKHTKKKSLEHTKKKSKLRLYFNNIDTCSSGNKLKNKDILIRILKLLGKNHRVTLEKIYNTFNFTIKIQNKINLFLVSEIYSMTFDQCVEWVNLNGIELLRAIYIFFLEGKLPIELNTLLGDYPHTKGEFTSLDIQNEIQLGLKNNRKLEITRGGVTLSLILFSDNNELPKDLLRRCFYLDLLIGRRKKINLEIWLSNKKKNLPGDRDVKYIGAKEVNSGCNTFTEQGNRISVWRREELPKVLIHEIIHSLSLEKHNDYRDLETFIYTFFDITMDNNLNLFECYVEIMAELINIFLIGGDFHTYLQLEITHCLFQVGKILNYFNYQKWRDFYREGGWIEKEKSGKYKQKSNVFSYFIFRSLIMFNINDFMDLCFSKNKTHFLKQDFSSIELLTIIKKTLLDKKYQQFINKFILINKKENSNKKTKSKLEYNNLRMTCVENFMIN